jgi:hypothetical protein
MIGLGVSKVHLNQADSVIRTRVNYSTIKNLCTTGGADFLEVVKGRTSLGGMLDSLGWKSAPSPLHPAPDIAVTFFFAGQNTWRYGSKTTGTIDATHLETYWKFMVLSANRSKYSNDLADVMLHFMNVHYGFTFNCTLGATGSFKQLRSKVFPNPVASSSLLTIESENEVDQVVILNAVGQACYTQVGLHKPLVIDLESGLYQLIIINRDGEIEHQKLIVQ